ncbi:MAG: hypothetical protein LLG04_10205 [Parachlamydia sp.]|nr:hypothetical protein [Parachlamydia sp.]
MSSDNKKEPFDFSLVLGGPLYQLWRRTHLCGDGLQWLPRRILAFVLITWVPLLLLSIAEGHAWDGNVQLPFLKDIAIHIRLLVALPLLILAELFVHQRVRLVVSQFGERGLIADEDRSKFDAAIASAMRLRNSVTAEVLLLVFVYMMVLFFELHAKIGYTVTSWHSLEVNEKMQLSLAGWWLGCVSLPLFLFMLLRWYFRLFIWSRFLWQVSRLKLSLMPTHPDRSGGLGFLSLVSKAFEPLLLAQGALLAGMMANRIFYMGATLTDFKLEFFGLVAVIIFAILGPLMVFIPKLATAKRFGSLNYGILAQRYVREFDRKWLHGGKPAEPLIGSPDIQSLADLDNSFALVTKMRLVPFNVQTVLQLALVTLLPVAPLLLTMVPLEELFNRLFKLVF